MNKKKVATLIVVFLVLLLIGGFVRLGLVRTPVGDAERPLSGLRSLDASLVLYYAKYNSFPPTLSALGPPPQGVAPNANAAGLVDEQMATGRKFGYRFGYHAVNSDVRGPFDKFTITADPISGGQQKGPHYFVDQTLVIHVDANSTATAMSRRIDE